MPKIVVTCKTCGTDFECYPSQKRTYCSMACRQLPGRRRSPVWDEAEKITSLYLGGSTLEAIGSLYNVSLQTVAAILDANQVPRRTAGAPRIYPVAEERTCANDGCKVRFTPKAYQLARGDGRYCSYRCRNQATLRGRRVRGEWVTCPECGRVRWYAACEIARGNRFCSLSCWGQYRFKHGLYSPRFVQPSWSGPVRQTFLGRAAGRFGKLGGRPRAEVTETQRAEIVKLAAQQWGRRAIANRLLLSERAVRNVLDS
jgi:hypothetical protein